MNFFRNYNRTLALAFVGILLVLSALFVTQLKQRLDEELVVIEGHVARHAQMLEFALRTAADQVDALRMAADGSVLRRRGPGRQPWPPTEDAAPRDRPDGKTFSSDHLQDPDSAGNLVGWGSLKQIDEPTAREVNRALELNPFLRALVFNLPGAAQSSFVSKFNFQLSSPWVSSTERAFSPAVYSEPSWQRALPERNPNREKFWAPPYFAGKSLGLMVPIAAPVYDEDVFVGVVRIDNSVDYFNRINSAFSYAEGTIFLVNDGGQVLAHPRLYAQAMGVEHAPALAHALPEGLSEGQLVAAAGQRDARARVVNGHVLVTQRLIAAPWQVVYSVPQARLIQALVYERLGPMAGVLFGMVALLLVTYVITRRDFVGPAAKLVQHLADASRSDNPVQPQVPPAWRPWFAMVNQVFRESRQLAAVAQELSIAAELQRNILPSHWPATQSYTLWGTMRPARQVGGDFYDHFAVGDGLHGLVVADVSGKGVAAALFAMVSKTQLRSLATRPPFDPGPVLGAVNAALCEDNESCMFVTGIYALLDPASGALRYANAGHPPPLLLRADGGLEVLPSTPGVALGIVGGAAYGGQTLQLRSGDLFILYTDGVTEAVNGQAQEFGAARLLDRLRHARPRTPEDAVQCVVAAVDDFAQGTEQFDDITCLALQFHPQADGRIPA